MSAVEVTGDGTEVGFSIAICARPLSSLTVAESADEVRVTAMTERGCDPNDCATIAPYVLDESLGDRRVVRGRRGQGRSPIARRGRPANS